MRNAIFACIVALLATAARAQDLPFTLKAVGPGVYAAIDVGGKAGSNAGFVVGDDGVVVIDAFFSEVAAKALLAEIRKVTPLPVKYVVNTHYHLDHTGGDAVFKAAGATIIAHRNVRAWLKPNNPHLFGDRITPQIQAQIDALPEPDLTTTEGLTLWLGARRVEVRAYPGHTGGDLVISVPDAKVRFCGDMLWRRVAPNIIDGTVPAWIATVQGFERAPDAATTTFVPGHGDVAELKDVTDFEGYLTNLTAWTRDGMRHGLKGQALTDAVLPKLKGRYGDWASIDRLGLRGIGYMEAGLNGTKAIPIPPKD